MELFSKLYHVIGDFDLIMRLSILTDIHCLQIPLAYYRWHPENMSSKQELLRIKELKQWKKKNFTKFLKYENFRYFNQNLIYSDLLQKIKNKNKLNIKKFFKVRPSLTLKLFFHFLFPTVLKNKILIR